MLTGRMDGQTNKVALIYTERDFMCKNDQISPHCELVFHQRVGLYPSWTPQVSLLPPPPRISLGVACRP